MHLSPVLLALRTALSRALLIGMLSISGAAHATEGNDDLECVVMPYRVLDLSSGVSGVCQTISADRS